MKQRREGLRVALVHDWLIGNAGGERVLLDLHDLWPEAPIYTLVYDRDKAPAWTHDCDIRTTYLQRVPGAVSHHKLMLALMPRAWEALDLTEFDLVVSSCMSCCKGVITRPDALHVCMCYSPTRYLWDRYYEYLASTDPIRRAAMRRIIPRVREWDYLAAQRVDAFAVDSDFVGKRVQKYYRREATTIYPGLPLSEHELCEPEDYYLVVSRFIGYKRIDLAIEACNFLGRRLVVVGSGGEEEDRLRALAGPTVDFRGKVSDEEMSDIYARAKGFLFPGIEDYGLTPIEAMASGVPVLAFGAGGALETVLDGRTGLFFDEQSVAAMAACIERFEDEGVAYSREEIARHGRSFSRERFRREFSDFVKGLIDEHGTARVAQSAKTEATPHSHTYSSRLPAVEWRNS